MIADMLAAAAHRILPAPRNTALSPESPAFDIAALGQYLRSSGTSKVGAHVTHDSAMNVGAVFQAVSMISGDGAGLTLNVYKHDADGNRDVDRGHEAQPFVSCQWNEQTSAYEGWRRLLAQACLWGNAYAYIERRYEALTGKLVINGLYNLLPDRTKPDWLPDGTLFYRTWVDGKPVSLRADEVFHLKGVSIADPLGLDLVDKARDAIGLSLAAEGFTSEFFASGCKVSGILELPIGMAETAQTNLIEGFEARAQSRSFGIAILRDNAKFQKLTASAQESQTHELNEDQVRNLARFFNMDPSKLGVKGSVSYNSQEHARLDYLQSCLTHWLRAICSEGAMKLLTKEQRHGRNWLEHNLSNFIEPDTQTMTEVLAKQIEATIINPNQAAKKLNLPPHPGGEVYGNPNTSSPNKAADPATPPAAVGPTAATPAKLLDVPDVRQLYPYDCGAAATKAVCEYFGVGPESYADYLAGLETTPADGTDPNNIIDFLHEQGLTVTSGNGLTLADLRKFFAAGQPVIIPLQMYGTTPEYDAEEMKNLEGHYVVVIGVALGQVMLQDPVAGRVMIDEEDFDQRWHDMEQDSAVDDHFGIAVGLRPVVEEEELEPEPPAAGSPAAASPAAALPVSALKPILAENIGRMARRVTKQVRAHATKDKLPPLLEGKFLDHRQAFDDSLRTSIAVVATIKNEKPEPLLLAVHGRFFASILDALNPLLEPPHKTSELPDKVEAACKAFEDGAADAICKAIL